MDKSFFYTAPKVKEYFQFWLWCLFLLFVFKIRHCMKLDCQDVGFSLWSSIFVSSLEEGKRSHTHSIIIKVFKLASVQPLGALSHSAPHARGALFSSRRESITKLQGLRKTSRRAYCSPHFRPKRCSASFILSSGSAPKLIIPFDTLKLC